jgi:hypothetical protein
MAHTIDIERRAGPRMTLRADSGLARARVRPGRIAHVLNISRSGALIETDWPLMPGARIEVQLGEAPPAFPISGRIQRCHVSLLERSRVRYRAALAFDQQLPIWELTTRHSHPERDGSQVPNRF